MEHNDFSEKRLDRLMDRVSYWMNNPTLPSGSPLTLPLLPNTQPTSIVLEQISRLVPFPGARPAYERILDLAEAVSVGKRRATSVDLTRLRGFSDEKRAEIFSLLAAKDREFVKCGGFNSTTSSHKRSKNVAILNKKISRLVMAQSKADHALTMASKAQSSPSTSTRKGRGRPQGSKNLSGLRKIASKATQGSLSVGGSLGGISSLPGETVQPRLIELPIPRATRNMLLDPFGTFNFNNIPMAPTEGPMAYSRPSFASLGTPLFEVSQRMPTLGPILASTSVISTAQPEQNAEVNAPEFQGEKKV